MVMPFVMTIYKLLLLYRILMYFMFIFTSNKYSRFANKVSKQPFGIDG